MGLRYMVSSPGPTALLTQVNLTKIGFKEKVNSLIKMEGITTVSGKTT